MIYISQLGSGGVPATGSKHSTQEITAMSNYYHSVKCIWLLKNVLVRCLRRLILIYQLAPWPSPTSPGAATADPAQARRLPAIGTCSPVPLNQLFLVNVSRPCSNQQQRRVGPGLRSPAPAGHHLPQIHHRACSCTLRESWERERVGLFWCSWRSCSGFH